ncbi:PREDICTED: bZIP transcription factor 27-like [Nicotiana attenuata]|uniref:Bzip transcription factor 27 n=1 Tax=Nicotiana attenuata TaxID=49451 RepID=A0A1J6KCL8_NICAT|nr:PREDICTED: bZIP transcription factor 27-like [Nicotiana attenuata]OIT19687.1 bzip transcription factor 27 [Nicotiana attenuata]
MSSSTSSSSSRTPTSNNHRLNTKTTEEVWKDINLSSLNDHTTTTSPRDHIDPQQNTSNSTNFGGMILQDFLARPFANNPKTAAKGYVFPILPPPAVTVLTLNSGPGLHFFGNLRQNSSSQQQKAISSRSFEDLASPVGENANGRKRCSESDNNSSDQKNKRMIKNRESAARSRARKQESAYTNELELKVAHLMEENARLKNQQQQLCLAAAAQLPKKKSLYRTSTAPF